MKQKNNFINDLLNVISKDYIFDLYESRYIIPTGVKSPECYINNTLDLYFEYHKTLNLNFFNKEPLANSTKQPSQYLLSSIF